MALTNRYRNLLIGKRHTQLALEQLPGDTTLEKALMRCIPRHSLHSLNGALWRIPRQGTGTIANV